MKETRKIALENMLSLKDKILLIKTLLVKESNATFPVVELENASLTIY